VLKGGIPDKVAAARMVLKDWNTGKIPYYTVPPKNAGPEKSDDAVVVSTFGKAFDLSQFDDTVLSSLKEQDEMDFVQLEDDGNESPTATTATTVNNGEWKEMSDFLMRDGGDGDDDMEMEDTDGQTSSDRARLAKADAYNFDDM